MESRVTALQGLRTGKIHAGQKVLINGASGGVGTFALQIAKAFNTEVTAVVSTRNVEIARKLGADHVIDYTKEDFSKGEERYDLLFDNVAKSLHGRTAPRPDFRRHLRFGWDRERRDRSDRNWHESLVDWVRPVVTLHRPQVCSTRHDEPGGPKVPQ